MATTFRILDALGDVPREAWDALADDGTPFVRWAWLEALERSKCVTPAKSWVPRHLTLWKDGALVAAAPAYQREDTDGDFARDWDIASAAARAGEAYYPKLCVTVPFTPVTGTRFLVAEGEDRAQSIQALLEGARALCRKEGLATLQLLFPTKEELEIVEGQGLTRRVSFQYHWRNDGYRNMDDFLARLNAKKRNAARREMRAPAEQGITLRTVRGEELARDHQKWARAAHGLHENTVEKLVWGRRFLNRAFYERVFAEMPEPLEVVAAERDGKLVAGAFNVSTKTHLFGRYWGCFEEHPFLHFNVCLYHSIDDCIRRGLQVFEGGAGGEHKISRGFEPTETYSAYEFQDARFARAMTRYLREETAARRESLETWREESPVLKPPPKGDPEAVP